MRRELSAVSILVVFTLVTSFRMCSVQAAAEVVILPNHSSYIGATGRLYVVGEVINTGDAAVEFAQVTAAFYNESNTLIALAFAYTEIDVINPERKSPFRIMLLDEQQAAKVHNYSLTGSYYTTDSKPVGLEILSSTSYVDSLGHHHIVGEINNTSTTYSNYTKIVATYYDERGTVIETYFTYTDDLSPGQSGFFEVLLFDEDRAALVDSYVLEAESWQYIARGHAPWDINGPSMWVPDGKCDMRDVALTAKFFGSIEDDGKYDFRADITGSTYLVPDGKIDMRDVALVVKHYGEIY